MTLLNRIALIHSLREGGKGGALASVATQQASVVKKKAQGQAKMDKKVALQVAQQLHST